MYVVGDPEADEWGTASYCAIEEIRFFFPANTGREALLAEVPPLVLSEVLRDADLAVGVASVGLDQVAFGLRRPDAHDHGQRAKGSIGAGHATAHRTARTYTEGNRDAAAARHPGSFDRDSTCNGHPHLAGNGRSTRDQHPGGVPRQHWSQRHGGPSNVLRRGARCLAMLTHAPGVALGAEEGSDQVQEKGTV